MDQALTLLTTALSEDYTTTPTNTKIPGKSYYGRCVYESSNDVVDSQVVHLTWDDDDKPTDDNENPESETADNGSGGRTAKSATLTMIAQTHSICERRGRIYGTKGEIAFDMGRNSIIVHDFETEQTKTMTPQDVQGSGHGGGDFGLVNAFVGAVDAVKNCGWEVQRAQREWVGMDVEEAIRSHAVVWAAETARVDRELVEWEEW